MKWDLKMVSDNNNCQEIQRKKTIFNPKHLSLVPNNQWFWYIKRKSSVRSVVFFLYQSKELDSSFSLSTIFFSLLLLSHSLFHGEELLLLWFPFPFCSSPLHRTHIPISLITDNCHLQILKLNEAATTWNSGIYLNCFFWKQFLAQMLLWKHTILQAFEVQEVHVCREEGKTENNFFCTKAKLAWEDEWPKLLMLANLITLALRQIKT